EKLMTGAASIPDAIRKNIREQFVRNLPSIATATAPGGAAETHTFGGSIDSMKDALKPSSAPITAPHAPPPHAPATTAHAPGHTESADHGTHAATGGYAAEQAKIDGYAKIAGGTTALGVTTAASLPAVATFSSNIPVIGQPLAHAAAAVAPILSTLSK